MSIDLNVGREDLTNFGKTITIICEKAVTFFQEMPSEEIADAIDEVVHFYESGISGISPAMAMNVVLLNLNAIFRFAESPIEKIFLNAFNILAFPFNEVCIFFTAQVSHIGEARLREPIEIQQMALGTWERFRKIDEKSGAREFIAFLKEMDFLTEGQRTRLVWYVFNEYLSKVYGIFYVTLQPPIKDMLPNNKIMRPDVYIWHPHYPDFKLIVECDGYTYHRDKASFSNDRARDRLLHMKGYKVLRFSGHDIMSHPTEMAKELYQYLIAQKRQMKSSYLK